MDFHFDGGGWMFPFYIGVARCISKYKNIRNITVGGVSAGSVVSAMILLGINFDSIMDVSIANYADMKYNPFLIKERLAEVLDKETQYINTSLINDRLHIGLSQIFMNVNTFDVSINYVNNFDNKDRKLVDALKASCHIPIICGIKPYIFNGKSYFDGVLHKVYNSIQFLPRKKIAKTNIGIGMNSDINPGIKIPLLWYMYPVEPEILLKLERLGYLRTKEYFKLLNDQEESEISYIINDLNNYKERKYISVNNVIYNLFTKLVRYIITKILGIF